MFHVPKAPVSRFDLYGRFQILWTDNKCLVILLRTSLHCKLCFAMSTEFLGNAKNFWLVRKCSYKLFLYGNHPNDSLIMKVIDQIMGLCTKLTWCKNYDNILFGQCEYASQLIFCMMATLELWKLIKTFPSIYLIISHTKILFSHGKITFTNNFLHGGHPNSSP